MNRLVYYQIILTEDGPKIVEVTPRLDGCHMWRLIKAVTGIDLLDACVRRLMGESLPDRQVVIWDFIIALQERNFIRKTINHQRTWIILSTAILRVRRLDRSMAFMKKWDTILKNICNDFLFGDCECRL